MSNSTVDVISDVAIALDEMAERLEALDDPKTLKVSELLRDAEAFANLLWNELEREA